MRRRQARGGGRQCVGGRHAVAAGNASAASTPQHTCGREDGKLAGHHLVLRGADLLPDLFGLRRIGQPLAHRHHETRLLRLLRRVAGRGRLRPSDLGVQLEPARNLHLGRALRAQKRLERTPLAGVERVVESTERAQAERLVRGQHLRQEERLQLETGLGVVGVSAVALQQALRDHVQLGRRRLGVCVRGQVRGDMRAVQRAEAIARRLAHGALLVGHAVGARRDERREGLEVPRLARGGADGGYDRLAHLRGRGARLWSVRSEMSSDRECADGAAPGSGEEGWMGACAPVHGHLDRGLKSRSAASACERVRASGCVRAGAWAVPPPPVNAQHACGACTRRRLVWSRWRRGRCVSV